MGHDMSRSEDAGRRIVGDQSIEDKPLVVSVSKAKALLDCSHDTVYDLLKAGELESYLESNRRKITTRSIERYIEKRLAAAGGEFQRCHQRPPKPTPETRLKIAAAKKRKSLNHERSTAA